MPTPTTLFEDAIDVPAWLEADRSRSLDERRHRDREIGRRLEQKDPAGKVRAWWREVQSGDPPTAGRRLAQARRALTLALLALGTLGGVAVALAALRYDGSYPVNVVRVLGLVIAPQLALLVLSWLLLPGRVPGLRAIQDALAAINPGAIAAWLLNRVSRSVSTAPLRLDWAASRSRAARRMAKWQMLYWSQVAAIGFNLGALAAAVSLIAFTDLAFGWSTTLDVDNEQATRIVHAVATPWQAAAPAAVPDADLVARSRFFRLDGGAGFDSDTPRALAGWWSFTLLALAIYGLLPRVLFFVVTALRLNAATRALLLDDPQVTALLDRLSAPEVATSIEHADRGPVPAPVAATPRPRLAGTAHAIVWSQCARPDDARRVVRDLLGLDLDVIAEAGGGQSLAEDDAAREQVAHGAGTVIVMTPAWEPPMLEFTDFLGALRASIGEEASIVVVPIGENGTAGTALERETWTRAVRRAPDARLYVEALEA